MPPAPPIEMSHASPAEFDAAIGTLARASLQRTGAFILLARDLRQVTILDPRILDAIPDAVIIDALMSQWSDDQLLAYLDQRAQRRALAAPSGG